MKILAFFCLLTLTTLSVSSQNNVGIGTANPDASAILDLESSNTGVLVPRMTTAERSAIANPANGLLVFDTDSNCFYFYVSSTGLWGNLCNSSPVTPPQPAWQLTGNNGTTSSSSPIGTAVNNNFIGPTDNNGFVIATNNFERERILATGDVSVNNTTPNTNIVFSAYGNSYAGASSSPGDTAIAGFSTTGNGVGVYGENINGLGIGVLGSASSAGSNNSFAAGVFGQNTANLTSAGQLAIGIYGTASGTSAAGAISIGIYGYATNSPSTGIIGVGNGQNGLLYMKGSGGAFTADAVGLFSSATNTTSGIGIMALGNGINGAPNVVAGGGVVGVGTNYGILGLATNAVNTDGTTDFPTNGVLAASGGYFEVGSVVGPPSWAYVGVLDATGVARKIIGNGTVNTIVKDTNNKLVALSCPEAPENLFQDLGAGHLENGKAHITLDPIFAKNIVVNDQHILRVFIQLEDNCNGVYVTNKAQTGFDVVEMNNGNSNTPFTWMVMANRADEVLNNGTVSKYSAERFPAAPGPVDKTIEPAVQMPARVSPGR